MDPRFWTIVVMGIGATLLIGWDIYVAFGNREPNERDTISGILLGWGKGTWILPFAFGVLVGHLFLPASPISLVDCPRLLCIGVLLAQGLTITMVGVWMRKRWAKWPWPYEAPALIVVGILSGHMLWYQ